MEARYPARVLLPAPSTASRAFQRYASRSQYHLPPCCLKTSEHSSSTPCSNRLAAAKPDNDPNEVEAALLDALKQWKTDVAWTKFESMKRKLQVFPDRVCVSRLIAQLCHQGTSSSVSKAQQMLLELETSKRVVELVDCDAMGLLVVASVKAGAARYSLGVLRMMLQLGYHPPVKVWSAVVSKLGKTVEDAHLALQVFDEVCHHLAENGLINLQKRIDVVERANAEGKVGPENCAVEDAKKESNEELIMGDAGSQDDIALGKEKEDTPISNPDVKALGSSTVVGENEVVHTEDDSGVEEEKLARTEKLENEQERLALQCMKPDTGAFNAALNACANIGKLEQAEQLWDFMAALGVKANTLTFNVMIKMYARVEKVDKLQEVLHSMHDAGVDPDTTTFSSLVAAYVGLGELDQAEFLIRTLRGEVSSDTLGRLRELYAKFQPDVRMYTTLMKGYVQQNRVSDALQLLVAMQQDKSSSCIPNEVTFTTAIRACAKMGLLDEARAILQEMARQRVAANVVTYNTLLQGVCVFPVTNMERALEIVEDMKEAGVEMDVVSYNTLINGYLEAGDNERALAMFTRMREANISASKVTYGTLMKAFARNGQTELVAKVFSEMALDPRVRIDVIAWNTLIDAYARGGLEEDATRALEEMKGRGFQPTNSTYNTLVKAYGRSRNFGLLILLWKEIKRRSVAEDNAALRSKPLVLGVLRPDLALLDSLIDAFVRGGYFQLALQVVDCMERQGIQLGRTKAKYKRLYVELYANLYTSRHTSERRKAKTAERRRAVEAFKFWVGLPNSLYKSEWRPFE